MPDEALEAKRRNRRGKTGARKSLVLFDTKDRKKGRLECREQGSWPCKIKGVRCLRPSVASGRTTLSLFCIPARHSLLHVIEARLRGRRMKINKEPNQQLKFYSLA